MPRPKLPVMTYAYCIPLCITIARSLPSSIPLWEAHRRRIDVWLDRQRLEHNAGAPRISEFYLFKQLKEQGTVVPPEHETRSPNADRYRVLLHLVNILTVAHLIMSDRFMARQIPNWLTTLQQEIPSWE